VTEASVNNADHPETLTAPSPLRGGLGRGRRTWWASPLPNPPHQGEGTGKGYFSGFTLLEVILALAILAGALAALGEVMRMADQTASMTEGETQAQILAASLMDEFASGARQLAAASQATLDSTSDPPWVYSVAIENTNFEQTVAVRVSVEQQLEARLQPARFELVRWMPNPDYVPPDTSDPSSSSSNSTSGSTSGSSGSSTGGTSGGATGGQR
jgi:type II secretion system protein I